MRPAILSVSLAYRRVSSLDSKPSGKPEAEQVGWPGVQPLLPKAESPADVGDRLGEWGRKRLGGHEFAVLHQGHRIKILGWPRDEAEQHEAAPANRRDLVGKAS